MLKIVPMTEDNVTEAAALSATCLKEAWSEEVCRAQLNNRNDRTLLAYAEGKAAGFLSCWYIAGEAEINNICVLPEFRRQGIARAMFDEIFKVLSEAESWVLEVRESNSAAIALYESLGFEKAGVRRNFYDDPCENAVIMTKQST